MTSARTQCPACCSTQVASLNDLLFAPHVDFFRCSACRHLWHVEKGTEGPARRDLLGQRTPPDRQVA